MADMEIEKDEQKENQKNNQKDEQKEDKLKLLEEDDEFEEFEPEMKDVDMEGGEELKAWEEDWDDDVKEDDFPSQLKAELKI